MCYGKLTFLLKCLFICITYIQSTLGNTDWVMQFFGLKQIKWFVKNKWKPKKQRKRDYAVWVCRLTLTQIYYKYLWHTKKQIATQINKWINTHSHSHSHRPNWLGAVNEKIAFHDLIHYHYWNRLCNTAALAVQALKMSSSKITCVPNIFIIDIVWILCYFVPSSFKT